MNGRNQRGGEPAGNTESGSLLCMSSFLTGTYAEQSLPVLLEEGRLLSPEYNPHDSSEALVFWRDYSRSC